VMAWGMWLKRLVQYSGEATPGARLGCEGLGGVRVCVPIARWRGLDCGPLLVVALLGWGFWGWLWLWLWGGGRGGIAGFLRVVAL
jgi:hypothetical protein